MTAELYVATADGTIRRFGFNGDGHHLEIDMRPDASSELLDVAETLGGPDGNVPIIIQRQRFILTVTATQGDGDEPMMTVTNFGCRDD
jgi:hypothetical protein